MATAERALLGQLDDYVVDGKFHEATEMFCRLARSGHAIPDLVAHVMSTAAPYLHVPAHEKPHGASHRPQGHPDALDVRRGRLAGLGARPRLLLHRRAGRV
jgi:hypothetical protein